MTVQMFSARGRPASGERTDRPDLSAASGGIGVFHRGVTFSTIECACLSPKPRSAMPCQGTCVAVLTAVSDHRHAAFVGDLLCHERPRHGHPRDDGGRMPRDLARRNVSTRLRPERSAFIVPIHVDLEGDADYAACAV